MKITRALLGFAMTTASIFFGCSSSNGATSSTGGSTSTSSSSSMTSGGATASSTGSTSTSITSSTSTGGSSTSTSGSTSSSSSGGGTTYCGHPSDCVAGTYCASDGTCQTGMCGATSPCIYGYTCSAGGVCASPTPNACDSDAQCASGLCLAGADGKGGVCTTQANQCFDQAQCGAGEVCAAGTCVGSCTTNANCRDGYACNMTRHVCTTPIQACSITNDCGGATQVCVDGACVPRSIGGNCPNAGDVWTENGCIPDQTATFTCVTEGQLGSGNGVPGQTCKSGSICLHHDCWISCDAPNQNACATQTILNTCKPVTSGASTYNVCGTAQDLGSQCGAGAANMTCANGFICIDGFCK